MKYVVSLLLGVVIGALSLLAGFYLNPFVGRPTLSPLVVDDGALLNLNYSMAASQSVLLTNDGDRFTSTHPEKVAELWEPSVNRSQLRVATLMDSRGNEAGIGIKVSTPSEETQMYRSAILVDSVWYIYLPGRGTVGVYQQEDYWAYLRDVVVPAWRSSSDAWRGTWNRNMTVGPGALGTARVFGLAGTFDGLQSEAVESLNARAYSMQQGPVSMTATLDIAMSSGEPVAASPND